MIRRYEGKGSFNKVEIMKASCQVGKKTTGKLQVDKLKEGRQAGKQASWKVGLQVGKKTRR